MTRSSAQVRFDSRRSLPLSRSLALTLSRSLELRLHLPCLFLLFFSSTLIFVFVFFQVNGFSSEKLIEVRLVICSLFLQAFGLVFNSLASCSVRSCDRSGLSLSLSLTSSLTLSFSLALSLCVCVCR